MHRFRRGFILLSIGIALLLAAFGQNSLAGFASRLSMPDTPGETISAYMPLLGWRMTTPLLPPTPAPPQPHPGLPMSGFLTDDFTGSLVCDNCHSNLQDESGADVTIANDWRSTMMANAARDPLWQAKVSSEIARHPELAEEIEATCSRCHMPMAYTQAVVNGEQPAMFGEGFLNPANPLHAAAMDGVSCTLCHQIQPDQLGTPASFSGHFVIDTATQPPDRQLFGPYPDPDMINTAIMRSGSQYTPVQGLHMGDSGLCASCHTLFTPYVDGAGQTQQFPEQAPYLEWLHSDYADGQSQERQCQDCHMPTAEGSVTLFPSAPPRQPFYQHHFVGGNVFMLKILQANVEALGLTASTAEFETTIQRTLAQLQNNTATIAVEQVERTGNQVRAVVQVQNKTGHKFPTSYPSRRAWLHVILRDGRGEPVFESGRPLSYGGIVDNDNDLGSATLEPHRQRITSPDQVQIYEAIIGNAEGDITYTLLDAAQYVKDNRLLPTGFDKATAGPDIAVRGAAAQDADFIGGGDTVIYEMPVGASSGPYTVEVELLYQTLSFAFVQDLRTSATPYVDAFGALFDQADKSPIVIDAAEMTVP